MENISQPARKESMSVREVATKKRKTSELSTSEEEKLKIFKVQAALDGISVSVATKCQHITEGEWGPHDGGPCGFYVYTKIGDHWRIISPCKHHVDNYTVRGVWKRL